VSPVADRIHLTRRGLLAAAGVTLLAACGRAQEEMSAERGRDNGFELLIGASLELTGQGAALGVLQERALQITAEKLNEAGVPVGSLRRTLRLLIRDNAGDPQTAAEQATNLIKSEGVQVLIGGTLTETSLAMIKVAEQERVPLISLAAGDGIALPLSRRTFVFKLTPDARDVARRIARLSRSEGVPEVGVLAAPGAYGDSGVDALTGALRTAGQTLGPVVRLPDDDIDTATAAREIAADRPGGVIIWAPAPYAGAAARALRKNGYQGKLFFEPGAVAEDTLNERNSPAMEGALVVHPMSLGGSSLTNTTTAALDRRDFVFRYVQRHGSFSGFAPYGADALRLIANSARFANSVDRGRLRAYLESQSVEGLVGSYAFTPIRHGGMEADSLGVFTVSQGAWSRIS
jgi:branched-chain amino acid transport system substrate-binding protein